MEDVVDACVRQRGCAVSNLLVTYERLLKAGADAEGNLVAEDPEDDAGDDHAAQLAADVPEAARAARLLDDDHRFDRMVQYNPAVQQAIRRWLTDMRGALIASHENYQYMRHLMWPQFERAGLPEALLFGIMAKESNGKVHATSRAGAAGPMQFMYDTGLRFGIGPDGSGFDTRYDPLSAARASASYLNERMRQLNDSIELALAAYNGGEGRAKRIYDAGGGRGFWDARIYEQFPAETRDYVPMVIAAAWLFLHPEEYGLDVDRVDARPASLVLQKPASIYELTICLGDRGTRDGYLRTLRNLNPRYQADSWLPAGTNLRATTRMARAYERYCVQGPRAALAQRLIQSDPDSAIVRNNAAPAKPAQVASAKAPERYSVQRGETLSSIARKFQCSTRSLARANGIKAPRYNIRPGQALKLEGCRTS
jgi:membrane-bound lytic murein transglycosylase D